MTDETASTGTPDRRTGRRLAAIVFADIAGYTELSSRDEDLALALIEAFQIEAKRAVTDHDGRVVKFLGDGMLAEFGSLDSAVASSHALQKAFSQIEEVIEAHVALRVGVHLGDVVFSDDGDIHGSGVNVASRIESLAPLSGVVVSDSAYRQLRSRRAYQFSSIGEHALKGVPEPMELYVVLLEGQAPPTPAVRVIRDAPAHGPAWSFARWAFAVTLTVTAAAYAADVRGVRDIPVKLAAALGFDSGGGRTSVQPPTYPAVEGGATVQGPLTLRFTGPIDPATATSSSIQLYGPEDSVVPVRVTVDADAVSVDLAPVSPLAYDTRYRIVLSSLLRSASGAAVELPEGDSPLGERLAFTTEPVPEGAPRLVDSDPPDGATGVSGRAAITVTFDELIDAATVNSTTVVLLDDTGRPVQTTVDCCGEEGDRLELRATEVLAAGGYTVRLGRGLADLDGEFLPEATVAFQVREPAVAAPPATGPGRLTIRVVPAELAPRTLVYLDGDLLGPPPIRNRTVEERVRHRVEIFATSQLGEGRLSIYDSGVTLNPGQRSTLDAAVTPFGSVSIISNPAGRVFIDGEDVGRTPLVGHPVAAGTQHTLVIRPLGDAVATHQPYSVQFTVGKLEDMGLGRVALPERR